MSWIVGIGTLNGLLFHRLWGDPGTLKEIILHRNGPAGAPCDEHKTYAVYFLLCPGRHAGLVRRADSAVGSRYHPGPFSPGKGQDFRRMEAGLTEPDEPAAVGFPLAPGTSSYPGGKGMA